MNVDPDPNRTVAEGPSADSLDAGLAAAFARDPAQTPSSGASGRTPARHGTPERKVELPDRYDLRGEIAHGGVGVVLRGHDRELRRDLAVKVLLAKHQDNAELIPRFIEEAQTGG